MKRKVYLILISISLVSLLYSCDEDDTNIIDYELQAIDRGNIQKPGTRN